MDMLISVVSTVFWGLVTISILIFIHEGGHFLAARACGIRVTEFFLGMPCRYNLHTTLRRSGTKIGVTPILLGGYAAICGMDDLDIPSTPDVLASIHRHGTVTVEELALELGIDAEDVQEACIQLMGWGSIAPVFADDDRKRDKYEADTFAALPRDAAGNTVYDGRAFDAAHATGEGEAWEPPMGQDAFFEHERSRTYAGVGFLKRAFMLVAGIAVNVVFGFLLLMSVFSIIGFDVPVDVNRIGSVVEGSPADAAGLASGDMVISVNGAQTDSWTALVTALQAAGDADPGATISLDVERDGSQRTFEITPDDEGLIGINVPYENFTLNPVDSFFVSADYIYQTVSGVISLLVPTQTMEVLSSSTSIVGISVMSAQTAASGPAIYLTFAALISLSVGLMNLLPIPPLDGGKLVIEVVQAITRRKVPLRIRSILSYVGVALFMALFVYMLQQDITRFF